MSKKPACTAAAPSAAVDGDGSHHPRRVGMIALLAGIASRSGDARAGARRSTRQQQPRPRICVVGVGGGGCNAIGHMIRRGFDDVDFIAINTDCPTLSETIAGEHILLAGKTGPFPGGALEAGRRAARRSLPQIRRALAGADMCFIAAGMGGGTATGAAGVIAGAARAMGILTVAVVTRPFAFEGGRRERLAELGIAELRRNADTLIVISNQNLLRASGNDMTVDAAFRAADEVLEHGVRNITDLIVRPGIVNVDFADVRAVMQGMGRAVLGTGEGAGRRRALDAAERAVGNRLLDGALDGARNLLISIVGGDDMRLGEIDEAAKCVTDRVHPDARIIWGSAHDPRLKGRIRVSVVATGIEAHAPAMPTGSVVSCLFGAHTARARTSFNQGFQFSRCRHCGCDLIRSRAEWRRVPRGFRVVWRGGRRTPGPDIKLATVASAGRPECLHWWQALRAGCYLLAWHWADELGYWRRAVGLA